MKMPVNLFSHFYSCRTPINLDVDELLQNHVMEVKEHSGKANKIRDRLLYVINAVVVSQMSQREKGEIVGNDDYTPLCSELLQPTIRHYSLYLKYLVDNKVVEIGDMGKPGESCTTYRFTDQYRSQGFRKYFIYDPAFLKVIYGKRRDSIVIKKYKKQWETLNQLTVDWKIADQILNQLYGKKDSPNKGKQIERLKAIEDPRKATFQVNSTGRLSTTICNLHKELRKCLRLQGQPLVEVDIKSSIPFFSTAFFTKTLYEQGIDKIIINVNPKLNNHGELPPWLMLVEIECSPDDYPDVGRYVEFVKSGGFGLYDNLVDDFNLLPGRLYTRESVKKKMMEILNSPNAFDSMEKNILESQFPSIMQAFQQINEGFYKTRNGRGNAKWKPGDQVCPFANVTQQFEARVILDVIAKKLEDMGIPLLTLHDCILSIPAHLETIKETMITEIEVIMSYPPALSVTNHSES